MSSSVDAKSIRPPDTDKTFGTLVRQLRLQKSYSFRELARRIDISPNFLPKEGPGRPRRPSISPLG